MALPSTFRENSRARITAYLKAMEDMVSLQTEFNADGGAAFFPAQGDIMWTGYDLTRTQYMAALTAIGQVIAVYQGGSASTDSTRPTALYLAKV